MLRFSKRRIQASGRTSVLRFIAFHNDASSNDRATHVAPLAEGDFLSGENDLLVSRYLQHRGFFCEAEFESHKLADMVGRFSCCTSQHDGFDVLWIERLLEI